MQFYLSTTSHYFVLQHLFSVIRNGKNYITILYIDLKKACGYMKIVVLGIYVIMFFFFFFLQGDFLFTIKDHTNCKNTIHRISLVTQVVLKLSLSKCLKSNKHLEDNTTKNTITRPIEEMGKQLQEFGALKGLDSMVGNLLFQVICTFCWIQTYDYLLFHWKHLPFHLHQMVVLLHM